MQIVAKVKSFSAANLCQSGKASYPAILVLHQIHEGEPTLSQDADNPDYNRAREQSHAIWSLSGRTCTHTSFR